MNLVQSTSRQTVSRGLTSTATGLEYVQLGLLEEDRAGWQRFDGWKATPGGAQILNRAFRLAAGFVPRWRRTGQQVSADYIFHILRYRLSGIRRELRRRGIVLKKLDGYALNNSLTPYVARHMELRRPEWSGLFEKRELAARRKRI